MAVWDLGLRLQVISHGTQGQRLCQFQFIIQPTKESDSYRTAAAIYPKPSWLIRTLSTSSACCGSRLRRDGLVAKIANTLEIGALQSLSISHEAVYSTNTVWRGHRLPDKSTLHNRVHFILDVVTREALEGCAVLDQQQSLVHFF